MNRERWRRCLRLAGRKPATALLRDLQDLWLMVNESIVSTAVLLQAVRALADRELEHDLATIEGRNERQRVWLLSRIRQAGLRRSRFRRDMCNCPHLANAFLCSENLQIVGVEEALIRQTCNLKLAIT